MPTNYYATMQARSKHTVGLFFDQHKSADHPEGRPWWAWTETMADPTHPRGVIGELQPVTSDMHSGGVTIKGWNAPWYPEQKYVAMSMGLMASNRFRIDYVRQVTDYKAANQQYYTLAARTAGARNWPAPQMYGPVDFQLRALIGDPPKSPKVPEAAQAEDPWVLFGTGTPNEQIKRIIDAEQHKTVLPEYEGPEENPLQSLSQDDLAELLEVVKQNKQAKVMRAAKAAKLSEAA